MEKEQLEALRRQVEEDYRLDLAAIDRLQRRYLTGVNGVNTTPACTVNNSGPVSVYTAPHKWSEEHESRGEPPIPVLCTPGERQKDEVVGTLRTMFSAGRNI